MTKQRLAFGKPGRKKRPLRSHHLLGTGRAYPIMALLPKAARSREAGYIYANYFPKSPS
jgi:hypothetical protein